MKTAAWLQRHQRDTYVKQAQQQRYCSRAAFKLLEIAATTRLFHRVQTILDLGAAPGSWSQVAARQAPGAKIIAIDLLPIAPTPGVITLQGNLFEDTTWKQIDTHTGGRPIDLILSDMAPNLSGIKAVDEARSQVIYELLLKLACTRLARANGALVGKFFPGAGAQNMRKQIARYFVHSKIIKPAASRSESSESYLWAKTIAKR